MEIREEVLKRIVPTSAEQKRIDKAVSELIRLTRSIAKERKLPFEPVLVGSVAKGTHLTSPDIDLFLRFPTRIPVEQIGIIDKEIGREILENPEERYAEHAYISGSWHGFKTDLVPCYDVPSGHGRISAVDRTPFHTDYIKKHLSDEQKMDVRLLKQFAKGIGAYGAEAKIQGFSGYLCEILILKFGNFESIISSASKWRLTTEFWLEEKTTKKFDEPFVFVDPVDPGRNVASPVSTEKISLFIMACKSYNKNPSSDFFFPKEQEMLDDDKLTSAIEKSPGTILVELPHIDVVDDVLWPQLRKTGVSIFDILKREEFSPIKLTLDSDQKRNLVIVSGEIQELPKYYIHDGPPASSKESEKFKDKWSTKGASPPIVKRGRWQVEVEREARTPKEVLQKHFKSIRLGKGFRKMESPIIVSGEGLLKVKYRRAMTIHFDEKRPWER